MQGLKVLNSRSTVRELSLEDVYQNTLLCSSCFARSFNCCKTPCVELKHAWHIVCVSSARVSLTCVHVFAVYNVICTCLASYQSHYLLHYYRYSYIHQYIYHLHAYGYMHMQINDVQSTCIIVIIRMHFSVHVHMSHAGIYKVHIHACNVELYDVCICGL